jgi:hypothetical protein
MRLHPRRARLSLVALFLASLASCADAPMHRNAKDASHIEGLWQYPNRSVWIQIWPDGYALQCRVAPDGTVFVSDGNIAGDFVTWVDNWPEGVIERGEEGRLSLVDAWGSYEFEPGCPMSFQCAVHVLRPAGSVVARLPRRCPG